MYWDDAFDNDVVGYDPFDDDVDCAVDDAAAVVGLNVNSLLEYQSLRHQMKAYEMSVKIIKRKYLNYYFHSLHLVCVFCCY